MTASHMTMTILFCMFECVCVYCARDNLYPQLISLVFILAKVYNCLPYLQALSVLKNDYYVESLFLEYAI